MHHPEKVPSEAEIRKFIRRILFGRNLFCPECKSRQVVSYELRYRCRACRCKFSLLSHTWLSNTKIPLRQFWLIVWCFVSKVPVEQACLVSDLSTKAVRYWYGLFRTNLPKNKVILEAVVQLDEAYFGGWKGRTLLMAKQRGTRKLSYKILPHTQPSKTDAIDFVRNNIAPGTILCTDGSLIYYGIEKFHQVKHVVDIHKVWEFGETSEIEGIFGNLRTFIRRMYHHVTIKNLENIVSEFTCRFSHPEMFKNPRVFLTNTLQLVPTG